MLKLNSKVDNPHPTRKKIVDFLDAGGNSYLGNQVTLITDRDFLYVPDLDQSLTVGDEIYLDNQTIQRWNVCKGWYSVDDNPPINGWYLESIPQAKSGVYSSKISTL